MAFDIKRWSESVAGRRLDMDGVWPGECHDVWLAYLVALGGEVWEGHAAGVGYTDQVWRQFPHHRPTLKARFTKHSGTRGIRTGDVIFWERYGPVGGLPHVAVAMGPVVGGQVLCVTQNPGPVQILWLSTSGVIGYLRPKRSIQGVKTTHTKKGLTVKHYTRKDLVASQKGRTLKPGQHLYLNTKAGGPANAANVVGGVGPYIITEHVYAKGNPGDALDIFLMWQDKKRKNSRHYVERRVFDKNGVINANVTAQRNVPSGFRVFARAQAPSSNVTPATVVLFATDAYLIK